jgi:uncharacterized protein with von Willebrand factor type A (vWA) domain
VTSPATSTRTAGPGPEALRRLVGFGRYLRACGLPVGTGRILSFCRAAAALDAFDTVDLRLAARTTLISRPEDIEALDAMFDRYFRQGVTAEDSLEDLPLPAVTAAAEQRNEITADEPTRVIASQWSGTAAEPSTDEETAIRIVASPSEVLRRKDFAELTPEERRTVLALVRRLTFDTPMRPSRRHRASARGRRFDMRGTLRLSLRTQGEPFHRAWRERRTRPRPLVLVLDVSGSMAPYGRPLIEFAHAAASSGRRVEAFCFGTRLTRITPVLRTRDPDAALAAVAAKVVDWEGGTRIGESLKQLLDEWSSRSALRGAVVVLCSDGLERGEPEALARQMQRLARLSYRLVWVNPLKGSPRYEPLARGMAASLPFVDVFMAGHNLESLESLAEAVAAS